MQQVRNLHLGLILLLSALHRYIELGTKPRYMTKNIPGQINYKPVLDQKRHLQLQISGN